MAAPLSAVHRHRRVRTDIALACLAIIGLVAWTSIALAPVNVDVAWLLVACGRLLDGSVLHRDVIEVNPPFSIWLYMPFVVAERATSIAASTWLAIELPTLALASVLLSGRILTRGTAFDRPVSAWAIPASLVILSGLSPADFGQREQFAAIAILPWLALLAGRAASADLSAGTAVDKTFAAVGVAVFVMIKPPLAALAPALPAVYVAMTRRSLRPLLTAETLGGAAIVLAYLAWLAAFHLPFFFELMPTLSALYLPSRKALTDPELARPVAVFLLLCIATVAVARPGRARGHVVLLLLAALGYIPAFLAMGKGWLYQAMPFLTLGILAFVLQALQLQGLRQAPLAAQAALGAGLLLAANLADPSQFVALAERRAHISAAAEAIGYHVERPTLMSVATRLQPAHPLTLAADATYLSRYPALWMIDNAQELIDKGEGRDGLFALRDRFVAETASDLRRLRPDVVVAGGSRPTPGQGVIESDPAIAATLDGYRVIHRDAASTVYLRADLLRRG